MVRGHRDCFGLEIGGQGIDILGTPTHMHSQAKFPQAGLFP